MRSAYGENIGTVGYDETQGLIVAQKDTGVTGTASLIVQGNDGTKDWYYSVTVDGTAVVTKERIQTVLNLPTVTLTNCKIWLETTEDNVAYATALATEFTPAEQITKEKMRCYYRHRRRNQPKRLRFRRAIRIPMFPGRAKVIKRSCHMQWQSA